MKFKVGDRVRCFFSGDQAASCIPMDGKITDFSNNGSSAKIDLDNGGRWWVHTKALRKLVKRERRRVWVPANSFAKGFTEFDTTCVTKQPEVGVSTEAWIEFIEVRRPK